MSPMFDILNILPSYNLTTPGLTNNIFYDTPEVLGRPGHMLVNANQVTTRCGTLPSIQIDLVRNGSGTPRGDYPLFMTDQGTTWYRASLHPSLPTIDFLPISMSQRYLPVNAIDP